MRDYEEFDTATLASIRATLFSNLESELGSSQVDMLRELLEVEKILKERG